MHLLNAFLNWVTYLHKPIITKKKKEKEKKKKKKKEENSTELQMPHVEAEVYDNNKRKCDWGRKKKKKKLKKLDFLVSIKSTAITEGG